MPNPLKQLREYISSYCHFEDKSIIRPLSLWIAGTYVFDAFDSYPYIAINSRTKRSGKTRLSELIGFTCQTPLPVAGATAPALFRAVKDMKPTVIWDEAEQLNSEATSLVRSFLNVGYRKGQTIPRATGEGITQWPTYCPKVFVLIGDVYDTLRDRSIVVTMKRCPEGVELKDFRYEHAKAEGNEIGEAIKLLCAEHIERIVKSYESESIGFLTDRDAEIWRAIFALARTIDTEETAKSNTILTRTAVDVSTEKTLPIRSYAMQGDAEQLAERESYARRLLRDMLIVSKGRKSISSADAIKALKNIDASPWRVYRAESDDTAGASSLNSDGLDQRSMSTLLAMFNLRPKPFRNAVTDNSKKAKTYKGKGQNVARGYARKDIETAAKQQGVTV